MSPLEFFKSHSRYTVESRDELGAERAADRTNVVIMLKAAREKLLKTLPNVAFALMTATVSSYAQSETIVPYVHTDIVKIAENGQKDLMPLLGMMDPVYFRSAGHLRFHVSSKSKNDVETPSAAPIISFENGKTSCEINMVGMSQIYSVINRGLHKPIDIKTENDVRGMVAAHEIAHCEFYFGLTDGTRGNTNQPFHQSMLFLNDIENDFPSLKGQLNELMVTLMERQADAKMLLVVASANLDPLESTKENQEGLKNFERHVSLLAKLREHEASTIVGYNNHDTKSVVNAVVRLVHDASTSPEKMMELNKIFTSPSKMNDLSVQLTIGSLLEKMPEIMTSILNDKINEKNALIKKSTNKDEQAAGEISVKKSMIEFENIYKYDFLNNSNSHSVDKIFIENSINIWNSTKVNGADNPLSNHECEPGIAGRYSRPREAC